MNTVRNLTLPVDEWKEYQKITLRFFVIYFAMQLLPVNRNFLQEFSEATWSEAGFFLLFKLATFSPQFLPESGFANWGIPVLVAIAGTGLWTVLEKKSLNYDLIYYS